MKTMRIAGVLAVTAGIVMAPFAAGSARGAVPSVLSVPVGVPASAVVGSQPGTTVTVSAYAATPTVAVVDVIGATGTMTASSGGVVLKTAAAQGYYSAMVVRRLAPGGTVLISDGNRRTGSARVSPLEGSLARLVNKRTPLAATSVPSLVRAQGNFWAQPSAARGYQLMQAGAARAGVGIDISESYRSYATQRTEYNSIVARLGKIRADQISARPGYSEHQLGLAIDLEATNHVCTQQACFGTTAAGRWIAAHAWQYGFVLRYPSHSAMAVTGYDYEPWHVRYVGSVSASALHTAGSPLYENWLGVTAAPTY